MKNMQRAQSAMAGGNKAQQLAAMQKRLQSMGGAGAAGGGMPDMGSLMKMLGGGGMGGGGGGMPDMSAMMRQMGMGGMPGMGGGAPGGGRGRRDRDQRRALLPLTEYGRAGAALARRGVAGLHLHRYTC
ncbi:hypothetical protein CH063_11642 [Colletotrichum higginsianum]|uniref:Uncharacterized protein n=1 Tax=Colletotrichum higginsianum (strain IMI 349063) TaxID=759273 RepID=H1VM75_COLHI|nr:hypothetical protein CH063_11642 [Colletotrichum higginsianum]